MKCSLYQEKLHDSAELRETSFLYHDHISCICYLHAHAHHQNIKILLYFVLFLLHNIYRFSSVILFLFSFSQQSQYSKYELSLVLKATSMDFNFKHDSSTSSSEEEEEEKISVRVDSCLLCAQPAVTYDCEGNVIKREPSFCSPGEEEDPGQSWSNEQLFSFLCQGLELKEKMKKKNGWGIQLHPFPFCEQCE